MAQEQYMICSGAENDHQVFRSHTWITASSPEEACQKAQTRLIPGHDRNPWAHVVGQGITDYCDDPDHVQYWKFQSEADTYEPPSHSVNNPLVQHSERPGVWVRENS